MPIEACYAAGAPVPFDRCPACGAPFEPFLRGHVARPRRKWWGLGPRQDPWALICGACKEIVGYEEILHGKIVAEYANAVGRYGPDSEQAMAVRAKHADVVGFPRFAWAVDSIKRHLDGGVTTKEQHDG